MIQWDFLVKEKHVYRESWCVLKFCECTLFLLLSAEQAVPLKVGSIRRCIYVMSSRIDVEIMFSD